MTKEVNSLKGAPQHIKDYWQNTGMQQALFRFIRKGATWEEAHNLVSSVYRIIAKAHTPYVAWTWLIRVQNREVMRRRATAGMAE